MLDEWLADPAHDDQAPAIHDAINRVRSMSRLDRLAFITKLRARHPL
jgi:hypothetical protein